MPKPKGSRKPKPVHLSITVTERTATVIDLIGGPGERGRVVDKLVGLVDLIARAAAHEFAANISHILSPTVGVQAGGSTEPGIAKE